MLSGVDPRSLVFGLIAIVSTGPGLLLLLPLLAIVAMARVLSWQRFRWGFDGTVIRVQQGVLQRRMRSIEVARVQQVEVDQPLLHRLVGLAVLRLETASEGGETEVELAGVSLAEAEWLRASLRGHAAPRADVGDPVPGEPAPPITTPRRTVLEVSVRDLALSAITGAQLLALPAAVAVLGEAVFDIGAEDDLGQTVVGLARGAGFAVLALGVALLGFIAAVVAAILRDGGYRVDLRGDEVVVRRGLLTTRETVLPLHRVQVVEVRQNWLRRALGVASVHVRSAGGGAARDEQRRIQVPLVRIGPALDTLLDTLLPERPDGADFRRHPPSARRRCMVRSGVRFVALASPLALVALALSAAPDLVLLPWQVPAVAAALLVVAGPLLGRAEYGHLAHAIGASVVSSRRGLLGVTTSHAPLHRLQGVTQTDSPFQRRLGLTTVVAHLAGSGTTTAILVHDVGREAADDLRGRLVDAASGA